MRVEKEKRDRRTYLGGHDAARIAGVFPYGSGVADTYARIVHGTELKLETWMMRGMFMEEGFAQWVAQQRGIEHERDVFVVDDDVPFFAGSLDAIEPGERIAHELTTTTSRASYMWGVTGTEDCAKHKWVQCQWYMGRIPTIEEFHVWCFVVDGDDDPLHYIVPRNEVAIAQLNELCEAFWYDHVLTKQPPLPGVTTIHGDDNEALNACFPSPTGPVIDADAELVLQAEKYASFRAVAKAADEEKQTAAAKIKALLRGHEGARWNGGSIQWKDRSIGEKTNWEQVAHEVALKAKLPGEIFNGIVNEQTFSARSIRSLTVRVATIEQIARASAKALKPPRAKAKVKVP